MKSSQHGAFLVLKRFHAAQDIVEGANCFYDVESFVEHDAFGAFSHRSIRYFRAGRNAVLGEGLEKSSAQAGEILIKWTVRLPVRTHLSERVCHP